MLDYAAPENIGRLAVAGAALGWTSLACVPLLVGGIICRIELAVIGAVLICPAAAILAILISLRSTEGMSVEAGHRATSGFAPGVAGLMLFAFIISFLQWPLSGTRCDSRVGRCHADLATLKCALAGFDIDNNRYPTTAEGLNALTVPPPGLTNWLPTIEAVPLDPWGRPYLYCYPGVHNPQSFDVWTAGPDGKSGTPDDIGNW